MRLGTQRLHVPNNWLRPEQSRNRKPGTTGCSLRITGENASPRSVRSGRPTRRERLYTPGWDCACTLVIDDNDAFRGDCAFRHLESRRDRAIGKQAFSTTQRNRKYLQPERIDQIMLEERLNEICASINVQIRPFLLLNFGDFFRNISV